MTMLLTGLVLVHVVTIMTRSTLVRMMVHLCNICALISSHLLLQDELFVPSGDI